MKQKPDHGTPLHLRRMKKPQARRGSGLLGCLVILVVVAAIMFAIGLCIRAWAGGIGGNYSHGERVGTVSRLSIKGYIWKSHEGMLLVGSGSAGGAIPAWEFSTNDDALAETLRGAMDSQDQVAIEYRQWWSGPIWLETSYEVIGVRVIRKVAHP